MNFAIIACLMMILGVVCSFTDFVASSGFWIASGCFAIAESINDLQKFNNTTKKEVKSK